jgi:hypothetical protein
MQSSVVVRAHRGSSVGVIPTATFTAPVSGSGAYSTTIDLADGIWTLEVAQRTTTGVSRAGSSITVLLDSAAPVITFGVPAAGGSVPSGFVGGTITGGWGGESVADPAPSAALTVAYYSGASVSGSSSIRNASSTSTPVPGRHGN